MPMGMMRHGISISRIWYYPRGYLPQNLDRRRLGRHLQGDASAAGDVNRSACPGASPLHGNDTTVPMLVRDKTVLARLWT
jgi:hypothetical protein